MVRPEELRAVFASATTFEGHVASGNPGQRERWQAVYERTRLSDGQRRLIETFTREQPVLVLSGVWCGDCVDQVPMIARICEANPGRLPLRVVDRDAVSELAERLKICGGLRVPTVVLCDEAFNFCALLGDRPVSRYRAIAARQLGAGAMCELGGNPRETEAAATLADWVGDVERVQLMLRLSPRLRKLHGD